jgi:hypothetical protein
MATQERQDAQDTQEAQVILPYWVQDHIHGETKFLIRVWLEWKS